MESMSCPRCGNQMVERTVGTASVSQCPDGDGVFLDRADLGTLVEAETDWHRTSAQHTAPLPKITPDMTAPPVAAPRARAWVESLFG